MQMQMQALHDVVQAGYVRYIGMSSCHAYQCEHSMSCSAPVAILLLYVICVVHQMQSAFI